ncbi:BRO family protein [Microbacterium gilvum]|uniref:Phage antirepressor Ant n=1 Tax=Microbacterium gilvum TaxID=1336204 RepID=A0ABP9A551_9MICO
MSGLQRFDFNELPFRAGLIDGEPWFVAVDVCNALDLANTTQALARLDEDERTLISNEGGREVNAVNEAGLYSLILGSRKAEAKQFKRWVTHEVLPTIRRTGSYGAPALPDLSTPEGVLALAQTLTRTAEELVAAKHEVAELTPRADAWDDLASADGDYAVGDAAKILARAGIETGQQRLFTQLAKLGWVFRGERGKWTAFQSAVNAGYLRELPQSHHHPRTGELVLDPPQVRVTVRGLERLRVRLGKLNLEVAA